MPSCYHLYKVRAKSKATRFDRDVVHACYLLTMENSSRTGRAIEEFQKHGLTPELIVQVNKGYKQCAKANLYSNNPAYDLAHALRHVFQDALDKRFERILVLEDDFFFEKPLAPDTVHEIQTFLRDSNPHVYNLGYTCLSPPWDTFNSHPNCLITLAAHAVIYNSEYMRYVLSLTEQDWRHHNGAVDQVWHRRGIRRHSYKEPLVFQPVTATDNARANRSPLMHYFYNMIGIYDKGTTNTQGHWRYYFLSRHLFLLGAGLVLLVVVIMIVVVMKLIRVA